MYNKAEVLGLLGQDPKTHNFENGSITTFSVATTKSWNDAKSGERIENTEWHNIVVRDKFGELCQKKLRKGSKVFVVGEMRTRKRIKDGIERYRMEIVANEVKFLDPPNRQNTPQADSRGQDNQGHSGYQGGESQGDHGNQGGYGSHGGYGSQGGYGDQGGDSGGYGDQFTNRMP